MALNMNGVDTHTAELTASVAMMLLKLKADFLATAYPKSESYTAAQEAAMLDRYRDALTEHMQQAIEMDADLATAWDYIQEQVNAASDDWDKVSYWQSGTNGAEGTLITLIITLKETLALVYAALNDKERFWKAKALPKDVTPKDVITLRGTFESDYEKDLTARLLTLGNTFKTLYAKKVCHTGIRNDLAMVLNGVYPGVWLVEDFQRFLWSALEEHLATQIESFRVQDESTSGSFKSAAVYREVLLGEISQERHEALATQLKNTTEQLKQTISEQCEALGINPNEARAEKAIEGYLAMMPEVFLPWARDEDVLIRNVSVILAPSLIYVYGKVDDEVLQQVKIWIKKFFAFDNAEHKTQIIDFATVKQCDELFKGFHVCLRTWDSGQLTVESIDRLAELLETYRASCLAKQSPVIASDELKRSIEAFATACEKFQTDHRKDWVENFFAHWFKLFANRFEVFVEEIDPMQLLFAELRQPLMQEKYHVTNEFLERLFNKKDTDVYLDLTPYLINRIFLHAITIHPDKWTPLFASCLRTVYDFVLAGFPNSENPQLAAALNQGSYRKALLQQIQYTLDYYDYLNIDDKKEPQSIEAVIPMQHLINSYEALRHNLAILSDNEQEMLLNYLGPDFLKRMIQNWKQLDHVFHYIPEAARVQFLTNLGPDFLKEMIRNEEQLTKVLHCIPKNARVQFLTDLGPDFLKEMIRNEEQLTKVLHCIPKNAWAQFLTVLGTESLRKIIRDTNQLMGMLYFIPVTRFPFPADPENTRTQLLTDLGADFLKEIIQDARQLVAVLGYIPDAWVQFLHNLGADFLKGIIQDATQLVEVLCSISQASWAKLLTALGIEFLQGIIQNGNQLGDMLRYIPEAARAPFLTEDLGIGFLKGMIQDATQLTSVLSRIPKAARVPFLTEDLGIEFLKRIIHDATQLTSVFSHIPKAAQVWFLTGLGSKFFQDKWDLTKVLYRISEDARVQFLAGLGTEFLEKIIKDYNDLIDVFHCIPEDFRVQFLTNLGSKFLRGIIQDKWVLTNALHRISKDARVQFLAGLGTEFLEKVIQDDKDLVEVLRYIPKDAQAQFLASLNDKFLQEIIQNSDQLVAVLSYIPEGARGQLLTKLCSGEQIKKAIKEASKDYLSDNNRSGYNKYQTTANNGWSGVKLLDTFGIYATYRSYRYDSRIEAIKTKESPTIEDVLKILNDGKGGNNLESFNYFLASHLLEFTAKSDKEAESIVNAIKIGRVK